MKTKEIIEKQKELIKFYDTHCYGLGTYKSNKRQRLRNELTKLEQSVEREEISFNPTEKCINYNHCEICGKKYYHNKSYHLTSEKLLCPYCKVHPTSEVKDQSVNDEEIYKKVYIKGSNDLPKGKGSYYCHADKGVKLVPKNRTFDPNDSPNVYFWIHNIDWYLQPMEQYHREQRREELTFKDWIIKELGYSYLKPDYNGWTIGRVALTAIREYLKITSK